MTYFDIIIPYFAKRRGIGENEEFFQTPAVRPVEPFVPLVLEHTGVDPACAALYHRHSDMVVRRGARRVDHRSDRVHARRRLADVHGKQKGTGKQKQKPLFCK